MILANTLFARFLQEKKVPAPFRIQEKYHQDRAPTVVRFHPAPHKGVGADAYLYATSPIRRVQDALAQRQLRSLLDLPPLPEKILYELSERSEKNYQEMRRWMRLADLYWKLRYLEQFPDTPLYGTVLRREEDKVLTRVSPIEVVFPIEKDHWKGEKVQSLKMVSVDAEKGELSLRWDNSPLPEDPFLSPEPVS
jgi:exoribonuclease R